MNDNLITASELAEYLNVPITWVWRAAREGTVPHVRAGRYQRFDKGAVIKHLNRTAGMLMASPVPER